MQDKDKLEESLNMKFGQKNILATFHPVTLEGNVKEQFKQLLLAFEELKNTNIIITCPNSDKGNEEIFNLINEFKNTHSNVYVYKSLGLKRYLSCLKYVDMVVGNSSSGIYEVPSFKIPTINIGNRQKGRLQAKSIINCKPTKEDILSAIAKGYKLDCSTVTNPYKKENTLSRIVDVLKTYNLENILEKEFYNIQNQS